MRKCHPLVAMLVVVAAACGGSGSETTDRPSTTASTSSLPVATATSAVPSTTPSSASETEITDVSEVPSSDQADHPVDMLRYGAAGLVRMGTSGDVTLVDRPVGWAVPDGAGGVLYAEWNPDRFGPTWWLAADSTAPVQVSALDVPLMAARVGGEPAAVGPLATQDCDENGEVHMVARILATGETTTLQCGVGGQDAGQEPHSFGGGLYVGVQWNAVHPSGRSTDIRLVFRDEAGVVIDHPANPYPTDCHPCLLTAALSPDGARLAVIHRPDAPPFRPDEYDTWAATTASTPAELRIIDLTDGGTEFTRSLPASLGPRATTTWFDGRHVVLAPDRAIYPGLGLGDRGEAVRLLQRLLVEHGADVDVDGIFGPGTEAAVEAFHLTRFGRARSWVGSDTWTELGVPDTVIDTRTNETRELPGAISLDVMLHDDQGVTQSDSEVAILRPDGIGPFDFGRSARDVEAWLVEQLGEPDAAVVEPGQGGWPLMSCAERRFAYWADAGFTVGFTDLNGYDADGLEPDCDDNPHLAGWYVVAGEPPWFTPDHADALVPPLTVFLTTSDGIGLGSPASELRNVFSTVVFGEWDLGEYFPALFHTSEGVRGRVTWNPTADLQRALNERGASLAVDGSFGPRTSAALADFQIANGISELEPGGDPSAASVGIVGPRTLAALDLEAPDDAPVEYITTGQWDWNF